MEGEKNVYYELKEEKEIFDLFVKKEEYNPIFEDQYERFPYYMSKYRNVFEPEVSKYLFENGLSVEYPDGKKFGLCLTHDIDSINLSNKDMLYYGFHSISKKRVKDTGRVILSKWKKNRSPFFNFKEIIRLEEKYNAKSSFYFLTLDKDEQDFNFKIEDIEQELGYIADNGWEVGLHGGHKSYDELKDLIEKKRRLEKVLGKKIVGYRNHYLRFKVPKTWELLSKADFKYDTTFGYHDCIGFRNGMCYPFKPFNLTTKKEIDILEIPLNIVDSTLFGNTMNLNHKKAWELSKQLIDTVEKYNGIITILWHNTHMRGRNLDFYEKILRYCYTKNAWITSGEKIYDWWTSKI